MINQTKLQTFSTNPRFSGNNAHTNCNWVFFDKLYKAISGPEYDPIPFSKELELRKQILEGSEIAKDKLIKAHLRFAISTAKGYKNHNHPLNDIVNDGVVGLCNSAKTFNYANTDNRFISYAVWGIRNEIEKGIFANKTTINTSLPEGRALNKMTNTITKLTIKNNGKPPTNEELAKELGIPLEVLKERQFNNQREVRLDEPVNIPGKTGTMPISSTMKDADMVPDEMLMYKQQNELVVDAIRQLPPKFQYPLVQHYLKGKKKNAISKTLGTCPDTVKNRCDQGITACKAYVNMQTEEKDSFV